MGNIFGKKKVSKVTEHDKAVLQVKNQRDKLRQYQRRIEKKLESEKALAKQLLSDGKRERAKLLLRKKRFQEQLLEKADGQLENLERMIHDLEFSQIELQVLDGLKVGNEALKKVNDMLNIEDVEKILDETREAVDKQKEIDDLLSGVLTSEDEEAVDQEFAELVALEEASGDKEEEQTDLELPEVPSDELPGEGRVKWLLGRDRQEDRKTDRQKFLPAKLLPETGENRGP
ncbi:charged multivesicular body protein 6-A isoform X1 [Macrosteles quadrilineatus]|uniref:charged multivesicular body protein 6-A isoform X1 n=1 Tax=Macrosteles quadrilineatus TaxID=74068 RepID=UPI0023E2615D|nr:charged multivesicular body protein 6-A isoform X1 [Macrosteles quadrilineatus]